MKKFLINGHNHTTGETLFRDIGWSASAIGAYLATRSPTWLATVFVIGVLFCIDVYAGIKDMEEF